MLAKPRHSFRSFLCICRSLQQPTLVALYLFPYVVLLKGLTWRFLYSWTVWIRIFHADHLKPLYYLLGVGNLEETA